MAENGKMLSSQSPLTGRLAIMAGIGRGFFAPSAGIGRLYFMAPENTFTVAAAMGLLIPRKKKTGQTAS